MNQEVKEQIQQFFNNHMSNQISLLEESTKKIVEINYKELLSFSPTLTTALLEEPKEVLEEMQQILFKELNRSIKPIITNCNIEPIEIWTIRCNIQNTLQNIEGTIYKITDPKPKKTSGIYECPQCGTKLNRKTTPTRCDCGRKGKLNILKEVFEESRQLLIIEDYYETNKKRPQARTIKTTIYEPLTDPELDKELLPGKRVRILGILKIVETKDETYDYELEANNIESVEYGFETIKITETEQQKIKETSQTPTLINDFCESMFWFHKYDEKVKEALLLSLIGSAKTSIDQILKGRSTINILLVSNPGGGKTQLIKHAISYSPIHRYVSGSGATAVGITGTISRDKDLGVTLPEPGILPLCNKGFVGIDELDKVDIDQLGKLNSAMSDSQVNIDKANVHVIYESDTSIIAGANPEFQDFQSYKGTEDQIKFYADFKDRFDLIIPMIREDSKERRDAIYKKILEGYKKEQPKRVYEKDFITKYVAYARRQATTLPPNLHNYICDKVGKLQDTSTEHRYSYRIIETVIRLAHAYAKLRLRDVTEEDVDSAMNTLTWSLKQRGIIDDSGFKVWELEGVDSKKAIEQKISLSEFIIEQCQKEITYEDLYHKTNEQFPMTEKKFDDWMEKLKRGMDIYEPRPGKYVVLHFSK